MDVLQKSYIKEMKESFTEYSWEAILDRAIPSLSDGLKPVQRKILYTMMEDGNWSSTKMVKAQAVIGSCMKTYYAHGDAGLFGAMGTITAKHKMLAPLCDGRGNWGSSDFASAASRYVELRLSKFSEEILLKDLTKEKPSSKDDHSLIVDYDSNYNETTYEPIELPSVLPNLLITANSGIAVGWAANFLPHNPREVTQLMIAFIRNRSITNEEMFEILKGPDFPTGGEINGTSLLRTGYTSGKGGHCILRGTYHMEKIDGNDAIVIDSLPYDTPINQKAVAGKSSTTPGMTMKIARLIERGDIEVKDLRDESDMDHPVRIVLILKRGETDPERIVNLLYLNGLQKTMKMLHNCVYRVNGKNTLVTVSLRDILEKFVEFREGCLHRKFMNELGKRNDELHIIEGLLIVQDKLDDVITCIRKSNSPKDAINALMNRFGLSQKQAEYLGSRQLISLTKLAYSDLAKRSKEVKDIIRVLTKLTVSKSNKDVDNYMINEWEGLLNGIFSGKEYDRKTKIIEKYHKVSIEKTIKDEPCTLIVTKFGYIKRVPDMSKELQGRAGTGRDIGFAAEGDEVKEVVNCSTLDTILVITNQGRAYAMRVFELDETNKFAKGKLLKNLLPLRNSEVPQVFNVLDPSKGDIITTVTSSGLVKNTKLDRVMNIRSSGKKFISIPNEDKLIDAVITTNNDDVLITSTSGMSIRVAIKEIRPSDIGGMGVIGMKLAVGDSIASMVKIIPGEPIVILSTGGFIKKVDESEFKVQKRGGSGVITSPKMADYGKVCATTTKHNKTITIATTMGKTITIDLSTIPIIGKATKGVKAIKLVAPDEVKTIG